MQKLSVPLGLRLTRPIKRPKLDPVVGIIHTILAADKDGPKKKRYPSKRVFDRRRDAHGFTGGITIVKDEIFAAKHRQREMFVPFIPPRGHARADFGEALPSDWWCGARDPLSGEAWQTSVCSARICCN